MERIDLLESKVTEMIGMVQRLHTENESLRTQLAQANERASAVTEEREVLDQERCLVRDRIEQLLGDIENITTATSTETDIHLVTPETAEAMDATDTAIDAEDTSPALDSAQTAAAAWGATTVPTNTPDATPIFDSEPGNPSHESGDADSDLPVNPALPGMS